MINERNKNILLAGASGALGLEILKLLEGGPFNVRALILSKKEEEEVKPFTHDIWKVDAAKEFYDIQNITEGIDVVISAMGKSVSLFTDRGNSFYEDDFEANQNLITDSQNNKVSRFVYVSIKGASLNHDFEIPRVHKKVEEILKGSDLDFTIIRPVGFFSGLHDLAIMAKRKMIPLVGDGNAKTNSIHQRDLAKLILENLFEGPELLEVGGPKIHTRLEMAKMISEKIGGKIIKVPEKIAEWGMFIPELLDKDTAEILKYFKFITTHDMIGDKYGTETFREYLDTLDLKSLP
ncbi:SDR family oxidoreductase [Salinimicrobium gaetbulicola]|uniref:SDR family oxidoreductase n=1 Tax=Salinimicrobium gaetbulicola TaxID=999702 RepID=A0ABW3ID86_9FLAO